VILFPFSLLVTYKFGLLLTLLNLVLGGQVPGGVLGCHICHLVALDSGTMLVRLYIYILVILLKSTPWTSHRVPYPGSNSL
jgi:hypothetical protein